METNNEKEITGVRILKSYYIAISKLPIEQQGIMYKSIMEYGLFGVEPDFSGNQYQLLLEMSWDLLKPNIDSSINNAIKKATNGAKGGRPKKETTLLIEDLKSSIENKAPESTISIESISEYQPEEKVSEIEEKHPKNKRTDLFSQSIDGHISLNKLFLDYDDKDEEVETISQDIINEYTDESGKPNVFNKDDIKKFIYQSDKIDKYSDRVKEYLLQTINN